MEGNLVYILLTLFAGFVVTIQGPINAALGKYIKSADMALFWSFLGGTIVVTIYVLVKRVAFPSVEVIKTVPLWAYLGAITGLVYVSLLILVIPHLGAGNATVLLILAQIITALILDHFGLFGMEIRSINAIKIVGAVLILGGVYLVNR